MRSPRAIPLVLSVALAVSSVLVLLLSNRLQDLSTDYRDLRRRATLPHRGYVVPTFRTATLSGDSVTVGESADSSTRQILFVFNTTCPFCRRIIPAWEQIADSLKAGRRKVHVLAISLDPADTTRRYMAEHALRYPVLRFPQSKLSLLYRTAAIPQTVVLDWTGTVLYAKTGALDHASLDSVFAVITGPPQR
jgi:cytochrome oxidase Cu insertion factor (SCO1/SenC/PrrC family)